MSEYYKEYENDYYNPSEDEGENANWKAIQKGFKDSNDTDDEQDSDITGLKSRMTTAENDINALEAQIVKPVVCLLYGTVSGAFTAGESKTIDLIASYNNLKPSMVSDKVHLAIKAVGYISTASDYDKLTFSDVTFVTSGYNFINFIPNPETEISHVYVTATNNTENAISSTNCTIFVGLIPYI